MQKCFFFLSVLILGLISLHCFHFLYRGQNQTPTCWQELAVHLNMNMQLCCDFSWKAQQCNNTLWWSFEEHDCFADWPLSDIVKYWNAFSFLEIPYSWYWLYKYRFQCPACRNDQAFFANFIVGLCLYIVYVCVFSGYLLMSNGCIE